MSWSSGDTRTQGLGRATGMCHRGIIYESHRGVRPACRSLTSHCEPGPCIALNMVVAVRGLLLDACHPVGAIVILIGAIPVYRRAMNHKTWVVGYNDIHRQVAHQLPYVFRVPHSHLSSWLVVITFHLY